VDWTVEGINFDVVVDDLPQITDPAFNFENGELDSPGDNTPNQHHQMSIPDNTAYGGWSLDIFIPSDTEPVAPFDRLAGLFASKLKMGFETNWPTFHIDIWEGRIFVGAENGSSGDNFGLDVGIPEIEYDKYQHYDLVRTEERLYVFIDNMVALNWTFTVDLDDTINYFTIVTAKGSNIRFDNIQITTDSTGLLDDILNPPVTSESTSQATDTGSPDGPTTTDTVLVALGGGSVALAGGALSWRRYQKKRLAKLIRISSNGSFPEVSGTISEIFKKKNSLYFLFLGHKTQDIRQLEDKIEAEMTEELHKYRQIFHPFRLSIINLLHSNPKITSIEVRTRLGLSKHEYYNSLKALEKQKLIRIFDDFDLDGSTKQFVILEEKGREMYVKFIKLVDKYVNEAKDFIPDFDGADLYPSS
jgi:DNA-binding MarR family transcriptional regulator